HCPATPETRHLIDEPRLLAMRPTAFLINTARGDIVDEPALVQALAAGRIAGAGLDVYRDEPHVSQALLEMDHVVLLPHLGSATVETRIAMGRRAAGNVRAFFSGRPPPDRVA
ncbi:MAG TPA: NAD(P)-dependent oxidoreductase, partial [Gemmatimonadales bacterium]|nr:NAD(P)-dependent oxidoreductase [Gemmatimonadales bacterium]